MSSEGLFSTLIRHDMIAGVFLEGSPEMIVSLFAALLVLPQAEASMPTPAPSPAAEKPICRREVATGSTLSKRICHTKAQWAAINADNAANMDSLQRARQRSAQ